jgi:hypothetical protein
MKLSRSTTALVALEDAAPDVLFETIPGTDVPLWPLLRWPLASAISYTEFDDDISPSVVGPGPKVKRLARQVLPNPQASSRIRDRADVLFVVSGTTNTRTPRGLRNWLVQSDAEALQGGALILQDAPIAVGAPSALRPSFQPTFSFEDAILRAELAARLAPEDAVGTSRIERAARRIVELLDAPAPPGQIEWAIRTLKSRARRVRSLSSAFRRVIDRVQPRVVLMQTAAYGDRSPFIRMLHQSGVAVAELQHGWIGGAHGAYNYGAAASEGALRESLPDALLTFGEFWSRSIRVPFETVAVGKPQLEEATTRSIPVGDRPHRALVVSSFANPEPAAAFTLRLRDALPADWRVSFRPHPGERTGFSERYPSLVGADRVDVDLEPDLYTSLAEARLVAGATSTVLYEAIALGTPVIVRRTPATEHYIDQTVFPLVVDDDGDLGPALRVAIESPWMLLDAATIESLWASGTRDRFLAYAGHFTGAD